MKDLENILHALKVIGEPGFEQQKKIHEDKVVTQERITIDMTLLHELDVAAIHNFCSNFGFKCNIIPLGEGMGIQIQFFEKESKV